MQLQGRSFSSGNYRYGFNGKENDNDVKGEGNQQDYGMRIYDPRIGKFLSVDPITRAYPQLTPYQFASNRPIQGIDLDGLEFFDPVKNFGRKSAYGLKVYKPNSAYVMEEIWQKDKKIHNLFMGYIERNRALEGRQQENPERDPNLEDKAPNINTAPTPSATAKAKNVERGAGGATLFIDALKWALKVQNETKNKMEIDYAKKSVIALAEADNTVRGAFNCPNFPQSIFGDGFLTDLVNHLTDGSLPADVGFNYQQVLIKWSKLLFKHHKQIQGGVFDFSLQVQLPRKKKLRGNGDMPGPEILVYETQEKNDPELKEALESVKSGGKIDRPDKLERAR